MLILLVAVLLLAWPLGQSMMFVLDPREQAVVLQFGKPVRTRQEPGLYFKIPLIEEVRRLPRTYQFWVGTKGEILENVQTKDGKKIEVTPWAIWRITDPEIFIQKLQTVPAGASRVKTFVRGPMRDVITANDLAEVVRDDTDRRMEYPLLSDLLESMEEASGDEKRTQGQPVEDGQEGTQQLILAQLEIEKIEIGRQEIERRIKENVRKELATTDEGEQVGRGIELVDLGIARIEFVPSVQEAAFQRQIAFREAIASWYTNRGEQLKQETLNRTDAEVQKIEGEGKEQANVIRGEVEAEIIEKYAEAIREAGEFYGFIRTLEAYKQAVGTNTRLILTTDSEMFRLLKTVPPAAESSSGEAPADKAPSKKGIPATTPAEGPPATESP
jgi:membrane protease subunit HflC